jgi:acyl carrier protein
MMSGTGSDVAGYGSAADAGSADNLIERYDFSSIDTLKYLLTLEEKFGVALADEDFNEELLLSATTLAKRIAALRQADGKDLIGA